MKPTLFAEVTQKCNYACNFCGEWRYTGAHSSITREQYRLLFDAARLEGLPRICFVGGEPTLFKGLRDLAQDAVNIARMGNMSVHIITNGSTILQQRDLWEVPFDLVKVSIQSLDPEVSKAITGRAFLNRVIEGIDYLQARHIPLLIHYVVTTSSSNSLEQLLLFARQRKLSLKLHELDTTLSTNDKTRVDMGPVLARLDELAVEKTRIPTPGLPVQIWKLPEGIKIEVVLSGEQKYEESICGDCELYPCDYGLYGLSITPDGFLSPCHIRQGWGEKINWSSLESVRGSVRRSAALIERSKAAHLATGELASMIDRP